MATWFLVLEVMDKEPSLLKLYLVFGGLGLAGLFVCYRARWIVMLVVPLILALGWAATEDLRDPDVGPAMLREGGLSYCVLFYTAVALPVLMAIAGALFATNRQRRSN